MSSGGLRTPLDLFSCHRVPNLSCIRSLGLVLYCSLVLWCLIIRFILPPFCMCSIPLIYLVTLISQRNCPGGLKPPTLDFIILPRVPFFSCIRSLKMCSLVLRFSASVSFFVIVIVFSLLVLIFVLL